MALRWPTEPPTLTGARVVLRTWRADDADAVYEACQDADIQRWTTVPVPYLHEHAVGFVGDHVPGEWAARRGAPLCIAAPADDRVLGAVGLVRVDERDLIGEIGYWIAPWARGQGVATEAVALVAGWAYDELGLARLELLIDPDNTASRSVADRAGFLLEGTLRSRAVIRGDRRDMAIYALIR